MAKFSRSFLMFRRVADLRQRIQINTQKMRGKLLEDLENIFNMSVKFALGEVTLEGKKLTMKQREAWTRVCSYTAQVMNTVAEGFDEKQIDEDLKELEKLVDEAKTKTKDVGAGKGSKKTEANKAT